MILIADSGGTSTDWCTIENGRTRFYQSSGLHPNVVLQGVEIPSELSKMARNVREVYFYGTGCATTPKATILKELLSKWFPKAKIDVFSDLMALAHVGLEENSGYVAILGTGASMAFYDSENLHFDNPSLGTSLDPGSGTDLAHMLHKAFENGDLPNNLQEDFINHHSTIDNIDTLNKHATMTFIQKQKSVEFIKNLIKSRFNAFFDYYLPESNADLLNMVFGGSVAAIFSELLHETAQMRNIEIQAIYRTPIQYLAALERYNLKPEDEL